MVPPKFAHKGMLWWRVVLTTFLFRIRPELLKADEGGGSGGAELDVERAMADMGWQRPVLGVHVRVGDSCNKWAIHFNGTCLKLTVHPDAAPRLLMSVCMNVAVCTST